MDFNDFENQKYDGQEPGGEQPEEQLSAEESGVFYEDMDSFSADAPRPPKSGVDGIDWQQEQAQPGAANVQAFRWDDVEPRPEKPRRARAPKEPRPPREPKRGSYKALKVFAIVVSCVLVITMGAFAYVLVDRGQGDSGVVQGSGSSSSSSSSSYANNSGPSLSLNSTPNADNDVPVTDGPLTIPQIAAKAKPSVVGIITYTKAEGMQPASEGSGIIMSSDGYIITNAHVVDESDAVKVIMENGDEFEARIIGADSRTDLAVIKIEQENLTPAQFGDSDKLVTGETVVAIGNPGGLQYAGSVTQGIVSATNRVVSSSTDSGYTLKCIQTDAAINPGNSGGALVNIYGQVIGINSSKIVATGFEGIGFSIGINEAKPIIDDLIANGYVTNRVKIGITVSSIDEVLAKLYGIPEGLRILSIEATSDASSKGLQVGDVITKVDGTDMKSFSDLSAILKSKKAGDTISLDVYRQSSSNAGRTFQTTLTLQEDRGVQNGQPTVNG